MLIWTCTTLENEVREVASFQLAVDRNSLWWERGSRPEGLSWGSTPPELEYPTRLKQIQSSLMFVSAKKRNRRGMGLHDSNPSTSSTCLRGSSIWGGFHQAHEHFFTLYLLYYPWGGPMVTLVHVHTVAPAYIWSLFHSREFHQAILQSKRVLTWKFCAQWMQILSSK